MSLSTQINVAVAIAVGGIVARVVIHSTLDLFVLLGDAGRDAWLSLMRACRLASGIGVALFVVVTGHWAIHRWFASPGHELDVVLIALAIMIVWDAGAFDMSVRRIASEMERARIREEMERRRPSGAVPLGRSERFRSGQPSVEPRDEPGEDAA